MDKNSLFEKNKNNILNLVIVLLALFIAFQIYKGIEEQAGSLLQQKDIEIKKNEAAQEIAVFERKIEGYKKAFARRDLGSVIDTISAIGKKCSVKVTSIKPESEEAKPDYIRSTFSIVIDAPDYHALGNFISQLESYQDIYFVDEAKIISAGSLSQAQAGADKGLKITLKISTVSYL